MRTVEIGVEYEKIRELIEEYGTDLERKIREISSQVVYEKYGIGGEGLHRGFYCPSTIIDIVVGNIKRGRIIQKITRQAKPEFTFGFDVDNRLVIARSHNSLEFINRKEALEIGISVFEDDLKIRTISCCEYNGKRIQTYVHCLYDGYEHNIVEWQKEQYMYLENELIVNCYRSWGFEKAPMMEHEKYTFHAENGYLTSYTVQEFDGDNPKPGFWDGYHFKISLRRKYDEKRGVQIYL